MTINPRLADITRRIAERSADSRATYLERIRAAARAASQEASVAYAEPAALTAAQSSLASAGITCQDIAVAVDSTGFSAAAGSTADVTVTVSCTVSWSDLTIPGWPGTKDIQATAASPLDTRRIGT